MNLLSAKSNLPVLKTAAIYLGISLLLLLAPARLTDRLRLGLTAPLGPVQRLTRAGLSLPEGLLARLKASRGAAGEIERLRAELARAKAEAAMEAEGRHAAESRLAQMGLLPATLTPRAISADVTGFDVSLVRRSITLNKGTDAGVVPNSLVVWNGIFAGVVVSASSGSSRAIVIGDPDCHIPVRSVRSRAPGSLGGIGGGRCRIKYVMVTADVQRGDVFVTAGVAGMLPSGILVGECTQVTDEEGSPYKRIILSPACEASALEFVAVLPPGGGGE